MSDDYSDSLKELHSEDEQTAGAEGGGIRIRLCTRSADSGAAFWNLLERRIRKKSNSVAVRSEDAGAAIYLLDESEFADEAAAAAFVADVTRSGAMRKILVPPASSADSARGKRMDAALAELEGREGVVRLSAPEQAGSGEDVLRWQAKEAARLVLARSSPAPIPAPPDLQGSGMTEPAGAEGSAGRSDTAADKRTRKDRKKARGAPKSAAAEEAPPSSANRGERRKKDKAARADEPDSKKSKRRSGSARSAQNGEELRSKAESKAERKAARKASRDGEDRGANLQPPAARYGPDDDRESRQSKKTERKKRKERDTGEKSPADRVRSKPRAASPPLRVAVAGLGGDTDSLVLEAIGEQLKPSGIELGASDPLKPSDVLLFALDPPAPDSGEYATVAAEIAATRSWLKILLDRRALSAPASAPADESFGAIARLGGILGARVLAPNFARYGIGDTSSEEGDPSRARIAAVAAGAMGIAATATRRRLIPYPNRPVPPDLAEARTLTAQALLEKLVWKDASPPRTLGAMLHGDAIADFCEGRFRLSAQFSLAAEFPIAWPEEYPDRASESAALELDFLVGPLLYWYYKANGRSANNMTEIDAALKQRGIVASDFLARLGRVIVDAVEHHSREIAPKAWTADAVVGRSRVLALYILCCRMALNRRVKFDEAALPAIHRALLDICEALRVEDYYRPVSPEGVEQDCLLAGLGLTLQGTEYGNRLISDALGRLVQYQLAPGLSADGVWNGGSPSEHCSVLATLKTLLADFAQSDAAPIEPVASAAKRMTLFAEAMLKSNGHPAAVDGGRQRSYVQHLSGARRALADIEGKESRSPKDQPRITETYVFRDAQYFVSHSQRKVSRDSSLAILRAEPARWPGANRRGLMVAFAHGERDLLVRGTPGPEGRKNKSAHFDPALRNFYRVGGKAPQGPDGEEGSTARISKSWRGDGWAAAKGVEVLAGGATIARTVVHLKRFHAAIIVDEVSTADGADALFEQFWNLGSDLVPQPSGQGPLRLVAEGGGCLTAAFDPQACEIALEKSESGSCVRRALRLAHGTLATLFHWSDAPSMPGLRIERAGTGDWTLDVSDVPFALRLRLSADELQCDAADPG
jgi:hypothetical protein